MLPKNHRLTRKKDFDGVFLAGQSVKTGFLLAKIAKNSLPSSRFGFVVSKKVSPKAVVRNKLKRRLRDAVAGLLKDASPQNIHSDVIIVALPLAAKKEFVEIKAAVAEIVRKVNL